MKTPKDFALADCLVWAGLGDERILTILKKWRSEVTTLAGSLHCAQCLQPITINVCTECGQTIHETS